MLSYLLKLKTNSSAVSAKATMAGTLVMAPKSVLLTFRRHDHLVSVLFGDLLSHSYYNIVYIFSVFVSCTLLYLYLLDE